MRYLIQNGMIVDGTGAKCFPGSVLIDGKQIAAVLPDGQKQAQHTLSGKTEKAGQARIPHSQNQEKDTAAVQEEDTVVIDAGGAYITPGFIDIHRHGDWKALTCADDELLNRQGITAVVNGNCGLSAAPQAGAYERETEHFLRSFIGRKPWPAEGQAGERMPESGAAGSGTVCESRSGREPELLRTDPASSMEQYLSCLRLAKRSVHTGMLAGGGTIRASVAGYAGESLSGVQEEQIRQRIQESLEAGALGVSLGMGYDPEFSYDEAGLVRVLSPLKGKRIPVTVHIRTEGDGAAEAVSEMIRVARALEAPLHLSHMKCIGKRNWRVTCRKELELIRKAREEGLDVTMDTYPYVTGSTQLVHLIPPQFQKEGTHALLEDLADDRIRGRITQVLKKPSSTFENIVELAGFENIVPIAMTSEKFAPMEGRSIADIARDAGKDPYDTLYDILLEEACECAMLDTYGCEEDLLDYLKDESCSLISDAIYPEGGHCHPRVYDSFPRFLIRYVREWAVFSMEEAVRKMTSLPASVYGLNAGVLRPGMPADLCVFSLEKIQSHASFSHPDRMCTGFDYVFTAGRPCVVKDRWTNTRTGAWLAPERKCRPYRA